VYNKRPDVYGSVLSGNEYLTDKEVQNMTMSPKTAVQLLPKHSIYHMKETALRF
jgi:hypothetical protein